MEESNTIDEFMKNYSQLKVRRGDGSWVLIVRCTKCNKLIEEDDKNHSHPDTSARKITK